MNKTNPQSVEPLKKEVQRRILSGTVASTKMKDTIVVTVERFTKDAKYQKYIKSRKRYKVHDVGNTAKEGDKVTIEECRPISRHKVFTLKEIMRS